MQVYRAMVVVYIGPTIELLLTIHKIQVQRTLVCFHLELQNIVVIFRRFYWGMIKLFNYKLLLLKVKSINFTLCWVHCARLTFHIKRLTLTLVNELLQPNFFWNVGVCLIIWIVFSGVQIYYVFKNIKKKWKIAWVFE